MRIKEAAHLLGISERTLRHYEARGLLRPGRDENAYRRYSEADLRRAARIRDMIASGFSTREVLTMAPCLEDAGAGACEGGLRALRHKLHQIDRLIRELEGRRRAVSERIGAFSASLERQPHADNAEHAPSAPSASLHDRLSRRSGRVRGGPDPDADRNGASRSA